MQQLDDASCNKSVYIEHSNTTQGDWHGLLQMQTVDTLTGQSIDLSYLQQQLADRR